MPLDTLIFCYVSFCLVTLTLTALYSDYRRRQIIPMPTQDHIFYCTKCNFVYTDDADVKRSRCPNCGTQNEEYRF